MSVGGGFSAKIRLAAAVLIGLWIVLAGTYQLLKPISNGCAMTYMYPTYIPISTPTNVSSPKYALYLYHEGWKKVDFNDRINNLNGVPVLFIPGNGGSYKQVRSLAAESDRAYQGGPLEPTFYQQATLILGNEGGADFDVPLPSQYARMLDWFAVDLEGEHSAMDGRILEEHTNYVVYAIHRILDQYKESHIARIKEGASFSSSHPKSVILVGHSMGGFVARAAIIHPDLRTSAVETLLTLSTPHQSPPLALQPSLGSYYASVNNQWRKGYMPQTSQSGHYLSEPLLSHVVVVSISGGYNDYQVRSKLESLDSVVPPTHGFMISSTGMKNVWLSMEHQVILWCNQLVVQVSHTLLSLIDSERGQPFPDVHKRLAIFTKMLHSGVSQNLYWSRQSQWPKQLISVPLRSGKVDSGSQMSQRSSCPSHVHWNEDGLEKDLYIQTTSVTVLAMDGRRRWLDIQKLGSNGKNHFVFVTNLAPCSGVRLHLWPEKETSSSEISLHKRVVEVTSKMVHIPSGPAPRQIEPGSQTEQAPPSSVFWLDPDDMQGFRFLTISVAPRQTLSGRPPPATSMGIGQFFSVKEGERVFSPWMLLHSMFSQKDLILKEDHPLAFNLSFSTSLGLLPVMLSTKTTGCGIKRSEFPLEDPGDIETNRLCKLRCFPPVALAWDSTSGLHVFPNLYSETLVVDSSPALWSSIQSEQTTVLLLVDPHCSYKTSVAVSVSASAGRFLLLYFSKIVGLAIAVVFFAMMRQAYAGEVDMPIPSMLSAVESNLRILWPFFVLAILPILFAILFSCLSSPSIRSFSSFIIVSIICYLFANGAIILLVLISQLGLYTAATVNIFIKKRWQALEGVFSFLFLHWFLNLSTSFLSFKVVRIIRINPLAISALVSITLVCFVHPALGLFVLLFSHAICCHNAICSFLMASFHSHSGSKQSVESRNEGLRAPTQFVPKYGGETKLLPEDESNCSSPDSARSFSETQLEIFHHQHGLLILHLLATIMFVPSMVAWVQRIGSGQNIPWFLDSALCSGIVLHGISDSKPEFNFFFRFPGIRGWEIRLSFAYLVAGYVSYFSGLALAPYRVFYPMAAIGVVSFAFRIMQRRSREKGEISHRGRRHSHRH